jgi:hypothetical protein
MVIQALVCEDVIEGIYEGSSRELHYPYLCTSSMEKVSTTASWRIAYIAWETSLALQIVDTQ